MTNLVHPKGDQSWVFIGRIDTEAETPILWPPHAKSWLIGKDLDPGRDWGQEEKGMTEDEMAGWHHQLDGHEFGWTLGVGDGQRGMACCDSWGCKELDMTEWLNWTELSYFLLVFKVFTEKSAYHFMVVLLYASYWFYLFTLIFSVFNVWHFHHNKCSLAWLSLGSLCLGLSVLSGPGYLFPFSG